MSADIDQKTYLLNKYLKPQSGDKKKKKKKHVKGTSLRIIDDDVDTSRLRPLGPGEVEALGLDEDGPQIAGIVDERPDHVREMEKFEAGSKWRIISQNDGGESRLRIEEVERDVKKSKEEKTIVFSKMYSDSEDEREKEELTGKQKKSSDNKQMMDNKRSEEKQRNDSDSDLSPPRDRNKKNTSSETRKRLRKDSDSDISPPRRNEIKKVREKKSSRWGHFPTEEQHKKDCEVRKNNPDDSDLSPPRKSRKSPPMYLKNSDSDISPPRKKKESDSNLKTERNMRNLSPQRKNRDDRSYKSKDISNRDISPKRRKDNYEKGRRSNDSDLSPPRRSNNKSDNLRKRPNSDSDLSPPRRKDLNKRINTQSRRKSSDSDLSPPRRKGPDFQSDKRRRDKSMSPRRDSRERKNYGRSQGTSRQNDKWNDDNPPPTNKKMAKTLEGKTAGLQDARSMRDEAAVMRQREDEFYKNMAPEVSGREATTVNRRMGKRETSQERQQNKEKAERRKELEEKYKKWGKGLKQISDQERNLKDYLHEASKPLARARDDVDLEKSLRDAEREGDPMLEYVKKNVKEGPDRPTYKGDWPPNRFNIRPGYRWDGVDRSNGYEKKYFDQKSKNKAMEEEAYKWSTEDL